MSVFYHPTVQTGPRCKLRSEGLSMRFGMIAGLLAAPLHVRQNFTRDPRYMYRG